MVERGQSIMPAMGREEIIRILGSAGFFTKAPWELRVSISAVAVIPKLIARITGHAENVKRLNDAEVARMADLFTIIQDTTQWGKLSPLEQLNLRQELTNLSHRRAINP